MSSALHFDRSAKTSAIRLEPKSTYALDGSRFVTSTAYTAITVLTHRPHSFVATISPHLTAQPQRAAALSPHPIAPMPG